MLVRRAKTHHDMEAVWRLTHDEYVKMGYAAPRPDRLLRHFDLDGIDETAVWIAEDEDAAGTVAGTISVTMDGPAGLHVDEEFRDMADAVRAECRLAGRKLGAPWRIVTCSDHHGQLAVSMALINACVEYVVKQSIHVTLYTFNPRHEKFYRRMLGFETIAGPRPSPAVQGAPAILMRGDIETIARVWGQTQARRSSARVRTVPV